MSTPAANQIDEDHLRASLEDAGQGHLLPAMDRLSGPDRAQLMGQLAAIDLELVRHLATLIGAPSFDPSTAKFEPAEVFPLDRNQDQQTLAAEAAQIGAQRLADGRVAFLLVAGGQASRLGYDGPKGAFPIGPVTSRLLFEYHARRILASAKRHGFQPHFCVMTSPGNDAATRSCFTEHQHFGLSPDNVTFFSQDMLPALDTEGRILLAGPAQVFLAPNGHGGVLDALRRSGSLSKLRQAGFETISYFQVDNPLAPPADPLFLGLHAKSSSEMSTKVVSKRDAGEKVGVIGRVDGAIGCIEYSDLPPSLREAQDSGGRLMYRAGNIAIHAIELEFVDRLTEGGLQLPWHVARKKMKAIGSDGSEAMVDGVKFETFVFDALGRATSSVTLEVDRAREFSPVKNKAGDDSPETTRRDLASLSARMLIDAGFDVPPDGPEGYPKVEVDPLLAETEEELRNAGTPRIESSEAGQLYTV